MMPENRLREELATILAAIRIHSATTFSFRDSAPIPVGVASTLPAGQGPLIEGIRNLLYGQCYVRPVQAEPSAWLAPDFMSLLAQANPTTDRWDPGWAVYQLGPDGRIQIQKGERSRTALIGEYASDKPPGWPLQTGDKVNLRVYPGSADLQTGFYFVFGDTLSDQYDEYELLRFYFNITAAGAPALLREVASRCNRYQVPFRFKTLADPNAYARADAAVLYCAKRYFTLIADLLGKLPDTLTAQLHPATPLFTQALRPGIAMAEEPGTGESFGMHRCRLLAESLVDVWSAGTGSTADVLDAVEKRFTAQGLKLDKPYLNHRSADLFENPVFTGGIAL